MILLRLKLDGLPPTVNHMHINAKGRRFRSKKCVAYQDYVVKEISRYRARKWPYSGRVSLRLIFTVSNKRRWDIDNRVKSIQDCLAKSGIIKDDSQIDYLLVRRIYGKADLTELTLSKIE